MREGNLASAILQQRLEGLDRVGFIRALVEAVLFYPGESRATRPDIWCSPARRRSPPLRPARSQQDAPIAPTHFQRGEGLGLPFEDFIGQPLEGLADHHKLTSVGSRAPRWMLERKPYRGPWPHSTPSTTRSKVWTGLTFRHDFPLRPASYFESRSLTITPSCPAASAPSVNERPRPHPDVAIRSMRAPSGMMRSS